MALDYLSKICLFPQCHYFRPDITPSICHWAMEQYMQYYFKAPWGPEVGVFKISHKSIKWADILFLAWRVDWAQSFKKGLSKTLCSRVYPNCSIASMGLWDGLIWSWSFSWLRPLWIRDEEEKANLISLLDSVSLSQYGHDKLIWMPSKSGEFSVKSASLELAKSSWSPPHLDIIKGIWCGLVPPRKEIFVWMALLGRTHTRMRLCHIRILAPSESYCLLCSFDPESCDHLLLHCVYSWRLWSLWLDLWDIKWVPLVSKRRLWPVAYGILWPFLQKSVDC